MLHCDARGETVNRDVTALKLLWRSVFHDDDATIDAFFDEWYAPELCAAVGESELAAMGFLMPIGDLVQPNKPDLPCAMIYAVATALEFRGRGYGSEVTRGLLKLADECGFGAAILHPADGGLFAFYERCGLHTSFFEFDVTLPRDAPLVKVTPSEYRERREVLLADIPHIAFSVRALEYAERSFGAGGL
ncbi:MAG: GNAT family N-acetyltransferase, partial [Oscillospiraceae bacterium]|nr:GNAT family N-acetyltransferase [Oscillospiraceae bacterium]